MKRKYTLKKNSSYKKLKLKLNPNNNKKSKKKTKPLIKKIMLAIKNKYK